MSVFYTGDEPGRAHASDAGADLRSRKSYTVINSQVIPVELSTRESIPDGYMGFLFLRSSVGASRGHLGRRTDRPARRAASDTDLLHSCGLAGGD